MRRGTLSIAMVALAGVITGALAMWTFGRGEASAGARPGSAPAKTHGEWIKLANAAGDSMRAYVAYPERKDQAPAVIVIHEIFGLSEWEPSIADRLAGAGYVAIVPDLLGTRFGITPANPDSGRKLTALLTPEGVNADLDAAYAYVNRLAAVRKDDIATIGFCWGGGKSFRYATANPKLRAAVVCYGPAPDSTLLAGITAKVLGVYGENDARITASLPDVDRQLKLAGKSFEYRIYPGTGHGFLRPGRTGSDGPEVERAWTRILAFYREALR
ncbi:MAG: dienelactone hydrolase family protein [Gemmatimonadota bacterium]|nr:dienelactone hydrolase family protein [Gemmatimonadota bacterium]